MASEVEDRQPSPTLSSNQTPDLHPTLRSERSQQDIELARQLRDFHSQRPAQHEPHGAPHSEAAGHSEIVNAQLPASQGYSNLDGEQRQHYESGDVSQQMPYQPSHEFTPVQQQHQQQSNPASSGRPNNEGQICSNCGTTKTPLWRRSPAGAVICNACGLYYKARNQMRPVGLKRGTGLSGPVQAHFTDGRGGDPAHPPSIVQGGATYVASNHTNNGTCPGGGRCNGTGGHDGCNGCPAYNNRISKTAQVALRHASQGAQDSNQGLDSQDQSVAIQQSLVIACQNCGTTITPLWRRDELGNTICNACGLYHKLHGHHRPVQMKKPEIKRRKRTVPANTDNDTSSTFASDVADGERHSLPPIVDPTSPSYMGQETFTPTYSGANHYPHPADPQPRPHNGPIPVDFTDMFARNRPPPQNNNVDPQLQESTSRKRSISATVEPAVYPHAQNIAPPIFHVDTAMPRTPAASDTKASGVEASDAAKLREAKRAELQAEADKMKQMLEEKERQIKELLSDPGISG